MKPSPIEVTAHDLDVHGHGIARTAEGLTLFVPGLLPRERALVRIVTHKSRYATARITKLLTPAADRCPSACALSRRCGGCSLRELAYEAQLALKTKQLRAALLRIGHLDPEAVDRAMRPILGMAEPEGYRAKIQLPCSEDPHHPGHLQFGYFAHGSHQVVAGEVCPSHPPVADALRQAFQHYAEAVGLRAYQGGQGQLRHLVIRLGFGTGDILLMPVLHGQAPLPEPERLLEAVQQALGPFADAGWHLTSLVVNRKFDDSNRITGPECETLYGPGTIEEIIGDLRYRISPLAFFQVNPRQTRLLFECVKQLAPLGPEDLVFDLYSGAGALSLLFAQVAHKVIGIEIVPEAVADAWVNAGLNGLEDKVDFRRGPAEVLGPERSEAGQRPNLIVVDPPRAGCAQPLLDAILKMAPPALLYVSCNPATLARDLAVLVGGGYQIEVIQPLDLFPHSMHVETVVRLNQKRAV